MNGSDMTVRKDPSDTKTEAPMEAPMEASMEIIGGGGDTNGYSSSPVPPSLLSTSSCSTPPPRANNDSNNITSNSGTSTTMHSGSSKNSIHILNDFISSLEDDTSIGSNAKHIPNNDNDGNDGNDNDDKEDDNDDDDKEDDHGADIPDDFNHCFNLDSSMMLTQQLDYCDHDNLDEDDVEEEGGNISGGRDDNRSCTNDEQQYKVGLITQFSFENEDEDEDDDKKKEKNTQQSIDTLTCHENIQSLSASSPVSSSSPVLSPPATSPTSPTSLSSFHITGFTEDSIASFQEEENEETSNDMNNDMNKDMNNFLHQQQRENDGNHDKNMSLTSLQGEGIKDADTVIDDTAFSPTNPATATADISRMMYNNDNKNNLDNAKNNNNVQFDPSLTGFTEDSQEGFIMDCDNGENNTNENNNENNDSSKTGKGQNDDIVGSNEHFEESDDTTIIASHPEQSQSSSQQERSQLSQQEKNKFDTENSGKNDVDIPILNHQIDTDTNIQEQDDHCHNENIVAVENEGQQKVTVNGSKQEEEEVIDNRDTSLDISINTKENDETIQQDENGLLSEQQYATGEKSSPSASRKQDDKGNEHINANTKSSSSMTPSLYVYNGITQSLPTQLTMSLPENNSKQDDSIQNHNDVQYKNEMVQVGFNHEHQHELPQSQSKHQNAQLDLSSCEKNVRGVGVEGIQSPDTTQEMPQKSNESSGCNQSNIDSFNGGSTEGMKSPTVSKSQNDSNNENGGNNTSNEEMEDHFENSEQTFPPSYNAPTMQFEASLKSPSYDTSQNTVKTSDINNNLSNSKQPPVSKEVETNDGVVADRILHEKEDSNKNTANLGNTKIDNPIANYNPSLLGPTPTPTHDTLSYPLDHLDECNEMKDVKNQIIEINESSHTKKDQRSNDCLNPNEALDYGSIPQTTAKVITLSSKKEKDNRIDQTFNKKITKDDIVDSDGEEAKFDHAGGKTGRQRSFTFLPPSPGKRQESNSDNEINSKYSPNEKVQVENCNKRDEIVDEIVEDPSQNEALVSKSSKIATNEERICPLIDTQPRDDIVEDPSQNEALVSKSSKIAENEERMCPLIDTQPDELQQQSSETNFIRIKRGTDSAVDNAKDVVETYSSHSETDENEFGSDADMNFNDEDEDDDCQECDPNEEYLDDVAPTEFSQTTSAIKSVLENLKTIDVNEIAKNLKKHPAKRMKDLETKCESLTQENKELRNNNKKVQRQKSQLEKKLTTTSARLEEKEKLCEDMKVQLDKLQSLIDVVNKMGFASKSNNKKRKAAKSPKKGSPNSIKSSGRSLPDDEHFLESDKEDDSTSETSAPKKLNFQTPKGKYTAEKESVGIVTISERKVKKKRKVRGNVTFQELWRALQEEGWKYKQGPEPYSSVYVPPTGSVKRGSVLGKDFFHADGALWKEAEVLGLIDGDDSNQLEGEEYGDIESYEEEKIYVKPPKRTACISSPDDSVKSNAIEDSLDNTTLFGSSLALTESSVSQCSKLIIHFVENTNPGINFMRDLWRPLWSCIKDNQGRIDNDLGWRYEKSRGAGQLGHNFWYCSPKGKGSKGILGKDYFTSEESVVAFLLRELKSNQIESMLKEDVYQKLLKNFAVKLSRATEHHLPFDEVKNLSSGKSKRQRRRVSTTSSGDESLVDRIVPLKPHISPMKEPVTLKIMINSPKNSPMDTIPHSQNTMEGAEILLGLNSKNKDISKSKQVNSCVTTKHGVKELLTFRSKRRKRKHSNTSPPNEHVTKRGKISRGNNSCHLTQVQDDFQLNGVVSPLLSVKLTNKEKLPLRGFSFFGSGIDLKVAKIITRLGGKFINELKGDKLKREHVAKKLFFLSDVKCRRNHKYLLAIALGVPMLQSEWASALENQYHTYEAQIQNGNTSKMAFPSIFDNKLYTQYRLPIGLSLESNLYVLQRASHAKKWSRLITESGSFIFSGLTIVVALGDSDGEKKWMTILNLAGATVLKCSEIDNSKVDICLVDSLSVPPHVTAIAPKISKVLNKISMVKYDIPIIDLSWATQCIVQKARLEISGRHKIDIDSSPTSARMIQVHSIKVSQFGGLTRYEVGDSVQFGKTNNLSYGRIVSIRLDKALRKKQVDVEVLELYNQSELIDGGKSVSTITLEESELQGHIVILGGKDFSQVNWSKNPHVFVQKKKG